MFYIVKNSLESWRFFYFAIGTLVASWKSYLASICVSHLMLSLSVGIASVRFIHSFNDLQIVMFVNSMLSYYRFLVLPASGFFFMLKRCAMVLVAYFTFLG